MGFKGSFLSEMAFLRTTTASSLSGSLPDHIPLAQAMESDLNRERRWTWT